MVADAHSLPFSDARFDAVVLFHTLTYAENPGLALKEAARVLKPGGRAVVQCLDAHRQPDVTTPYGERHRGFSPGALRRLLVTAGLDVILDEVACRESKKPHLQVVLAIATKPLTSPVKRKKSKQP
jgi:ArsR family transcriptional regulator